MRPAAVPDELVDEQRVRRNITVPDDLTPHVDPIEALVHRGPDGLAQISVRLELDPGEARRMRATGELWITFLGGVAPFRLSTEPPGSD